jgi:hypothetical protein
MIRRASSFEPPYVSMAISALLVIAGLCPLPAGWTSAARDSARSPEMNRAEREATAGGYYEGLIGGAGGPQGARGELALRLLGKPSEWSHFSESKVTRALPADVLQFELLPSQNVSLFGKPFTTNADGMRDYPYPYEKPANTYRIALLGSSMDMGWGVGTDETYENRLEAWLNTHAARRGLARHFEVLNFSMAAYGPVQRLESFRRKALAYHPDTVFYSATMLDIRLLEIHLCELLRGRVDARYEFVRKAIAAAGLTEGDIVLDAQGQLSRKDVIKAKLRPYYWSIIDSAVGTLAADCRSAGIPLFCLIVPRVGKADAPAERALVVAKHKEVAAHYQIPVIDLSATFDHKDPATIEIAAWDDHPNALGHKLLFRALAQGVVENPRLYQSIFDVPSPGPAERARLATQTSETRATQ